MEDLIIDSISLLGTGGFGRPMSMHWDLKEELTKMWHKPIANLPVHGGTAHSLFVLLVLAFIICVCVTGLHALAARRVHAHKPAVAAYAQCGH
jgi:hypothetical protein